MRNSASRIADLFANEADRANGMVISMGNTFKLILTVLIISLGIVFPKGPFASDAHNQEDYDYGTYLISHFFPSLTKMGCHTTEQRTNRYCIELANDGLDLNKIADAFPTRTLVHRVELEMRLPTMRAIFDCIANKCERYQFIADEDRELVINEGDHALAYLSCLITIPTKAFWDQALAAIDYYLSLPTVVESLEGGTRIPRQDELAHLFMQNTTFAECSYLKTSHQGFKLLRNIQPRRTIRRRF